MNLRTLGDNVPLMANPYEGVMEARDAVRGLIEDSEMDAQSACMFSKEFENVRGVGLGMATFKHKDSEVVVFAKKHDYIITDSRTVSQLSEIQARYEVQIGLPDDVEDHIHIPDISSPDNNDR